MANLDFPASPVDGQYYGEYVYVASKAAWQSVPALPAGLLAGTIMGWGGTTAPDQWLLCDGSAISRTTYSALFSAIGTTYGAGNGTTTFNLPDLRGKMPVGNHPGIAVTADNTTDVITSATPHGFVDGQKVYFTATTMPTNLTANTNYYVTASTATTFKVASSLANTSTGVATINFTTNGTGITAFASEFAGLNTSGGTTNHSHRSGSMRAAIGATNGNINYIGYEAGGTQPDGLGPGTTANYNVAGAVQSGTFGFNHYTPVYGNAEDKSSVSPYRVINYIIKYSAAYVPQESELSPRVDNLESGVTNYILNGAFDIWQRGTSFTSPSNGSYVADRWTTNVPAISTISRQSASLTGFQYCMRVQRNSGQTTTSPFYVGQPFEIAEAIQLAGETVTLSFYARAGANFSSSANALVVTVSSGTGASDVNRMTSTYTGDVTALNTSVALTTSWQRFSLNVTFGSTVTQFMPYFSFAPTGTAGANDYFEITGIQLQTGSTATSFRRNAPSLQAELAACQRYYAASSSAAAQMIYSGYAELGAGYFVTATFPVPMRVAPTGRVTLTNGSSNQSFPTTPGSPGGITTTGFYEIRVASATSVNGYFSTNYTASAEL